MARSPSQRIRATYVLAAPTLADARSKARDMTVEQTIEVPAATVPRDLRRVMVGEVERLERAGARRWRVHCSYDPTVIGDSVPQLFNLLFGNISLMAGIRLVDLELPPAILDLLPGPALGIAGIRGLCEHADGPLVCAAAKPIGRSAKQLADICVAFARGGVDIVKDDHGLVNQRSAPFRERVARCQEAVAEANVRTGGATRYFPHVSRGAAHLADDLEYVRRLGCRGVLLSPLLVGPDTVRSVAARGDLAILTHPTMTGTLLQHHHGIAPDVLFGTLFRAIGGDGVIYPNVGGRFPMSLAACLAINGRLRAPLGGLRPAFPVAGGGVDAAHVPYFVDRYGPDTMFLVGSSLYSQRRLTSASARLVQSIRRARHD